MRPVLLAFVMALAFIGSPAEAGKAKVRYYFQVTSVDLVEGVPAEVADRVRAALAKDLAARAEIITELPAGAPDPESDPEGFKKYSNKKGVKAYKVNVEVTEYEKLVEPMPDGNGDQLLTVRVSLRMFGETIPDRVMAFAGEGSATVRVEIGKKLRKADEVYADGEALGLAVHDATDTSVHKLSQPPPAKPTDKKKRKKKS